MANKHPDPDDLKPFVFPKTLLNQVEENCGGSFFLIGRDERGEFFVVPNFKNQPDLLSFMTFASIYSQSTLENTQIKIDNKMTEEMFGNDDDD